MRTKDFSCCLETCNGLVFAGCTVCYFAYVGIGGLIFMVIEEGYGVGNELSTKLQIAKENVIKKFPNVTNEMLDDFVSEISSSGIGNFQNLNASEPKWSFSQSVFFCITLLTTIGYGHIAPVSQIGKAVCMIYTSIGIPLTVLLFTAYVKRMMGGIRTLQRIVAANFQLYCVKPLSIRLIFFAISFVIIAVLFFITPAVIFSQLEENWTFIDALYFCFISLTTVGLGDFVPGKNSNTPHKAIYRFIVSAYLLVGVMSLTFLMALAVQCQEFIFYVQSKVEKAPTKPLCSEAKFPSYGAIVQEKVNHIQESKHYKIKRAYR